MSISFENISFIGLFISLTVTLLGLVIYRRYARSEFLRLSWFWGALAFSMGSNLFLGNDKLFLFLTVIAQVWIYLSAVHLVKKSSPERWEMVALMIGGFATLALSYFNYSYLLSSIPISLIVGTLGLNLIRETHVKVRNVKERDLLRLSHALLGTIFGTLLLTPFFAGLVPYLLVLILMPLSISTVCGLLANMFISGEDELNKELSDRNRRLVGTSKFSELGMMSAGIAHEINNPLAIIQARTSQLIRICSDPNKKDELLLGLNQILSTSERIGHTIQGIREFVHGNESANMRVINLRSLIEDVLAFTGQRMINHGVNLRMYELEHYTVYGNKIQLEQVILNLLNNSFDAIEFLSDKWIEISVIPNPDEDRIQLFIKDSGDGIPSDVAKHMMEPFFSTKSVERGTGLGLSLSSGIVQKHGGSLEYLSTESHTTFMLEIPGAPDQDWGIPLH